MMKHYSLAVSLPQSPPYDRPGPEPGNWYDSFLGNVVLPAVQTGQVNRLWFSHYGSFGNNPHAKFRFSTRDFGAVDSVLQAAIEKHSLELLEEHGKTYPH